MIPSMIRRAAQQTQQKIPFPIYTSPHKAQRSWPPDFSKISPKQQFRLERKYKRRAKLKWARPRWTKGVKIAQMSSILFVAVYGVLFLDWQSQGNPENPPFHAIRTWFFGLTGNVFTKDKLRRKDGPNEVPAMGTSR